ncbi:catalase/peroxidase HPI [Aestuariicella sp. G3-2]|uniref:catalase/peroxidase HPI n=1 Tax=Pseudomaricurvus albidus TaxID=2842452 RepID=UPI001C0ADB72|nr:catalase/peroxidase HPI [Aestuariicella albida]
MIRKTLPLVAAIAIAMAPVAHSENMFSGKAKPNSFWWPNQLDLGPLRDNDERSSPYSDDFDYAAAFATVDLKELKADIEKVLTTSQDWWPADWGHYGGLMIRMAWHSAGTYRIHDGRGGAEGAQQRFEPLGSWPDNVSLDKARRLLWPVKQKYGRNVSWADLIILAGNVSLESMGFETLGFAGGRVDDWEADLVYWGPETKMMGNDKRFDKDGNLEKPIAALHMGLIYVNPEGRNGNLDPVMAAEDIRKSFSRMAMNDEETVALIAGGHTLGKVHGGSKPDCVGPEPAAAPTEQQGLGWKNKCGKGHSEDTMTSGLEGAWTQTPTAWSILYLDNLFRFDWKKHESPGGGTVWIPTDESMMQSVPDAHVKGKRNPPIMLTTDLSLKEDPGFRKIAERFWKNPKEFDKAFAKAWFKLTHRDLGPRARYVGSEVPEEVFIWQDPVPEGKTISDREAGKLKSSILKSGLTVPELVRTAWASASTYRYSDMRGGANGARIRLAPQKDWPANNPQELAKVLKKLDEIRQDSGSKISMADMIVLGGAAAIEKAAKDAGHKVTVPFVSGRGDATAEMTDAEAFDVLEPKADAFRNYYAEGAYYPPKEMMVEKADLLALTAPEMTALVGGMRVLGANADGSNHGVLTDNPGQLSNDFFVNLLDMSTEWKPGAAKGLYEGHDRSSGKLKWTATSVDLVFGSNSELRALSEAYAAEGGEKIFIDDFVKAWTQVMTQDRFDL